MNARSLLARGGCAGLLALALVAVPSGRVSASAPLHPELKKLHVLIVVDTYDAGAKGLGMLVDQDNVMALLRRTVPAERLSITNLEGRAVTRGNILGYYERLEVGPDEGLVFYYSGHGATDRQKGHALTLYNGRHYLLRSDLLASMKGKGAGLVMALTDCCSTYVTLGPERPLSVAAPPSEVHPVVSRLFFRQRGVVDITAAELGKGASGDTEVGGYFTASLIELVRRANPEDETYWSWEAFFPLLKTETARLSRERRGVGAQHSPIIFELPGAGPRPRLRRPAS